MLLSSEPGAGEGMALFSPSGLPEVKAGSGEEKAASELASILCLPLCSLWCTPVFPPIYVGGHGLGNCCTPQIIFNYEVCNLCLWQESILSGRALRPLDGCGASRQGREAAGLHRRVRGAGHGKNWRPQGSGSGAAWGPSGEDSEPG